MLVCPGTFNGWPLPNGAPKKLRMITLRVLRGSCLRFSANFVKLPSRMTLERSTAKVVDHDVRICREALDLALRRRITDVERDPELVPVDTEVVGARAGWIEGGAPAARIVPGSRPLDLEDVGAKVPQQHRAKGTSENTREIEDSYSTQH